MYVEKIDVQESDYLYHQPSKLKDGGEDLFIANKIFKHKIKAIFHGEEFEDDEVAVRVINNEVAYFMNLPVGKIMGCRNHAGHAKYANDAEAFNANQFKNNTIITLNDQNEVCLAAKRNILQFQELYYSYGKRNWQEINRTK